VTAARLRFGDVAQLREGAVLAADEQADAPCGISVRVCFVAEPKPTGAAAA
jgi:hypothetical protein